MRQTLFIRPARADEFPAVRAFYHHLTDAMRDAAFPPGWEKDIYPAPAFLRQAIASRGLFLGLAAGQIAACMVLDARATRTTIRPAGRRHARLGNTS